MMWAVLPVKGLGAAKRRLADVLTPRQRRDLSRAMVEDVLETLSRVGALEGTVVVSRDPAVAALAQRYGARLIVEPECRGQTAAVTAAAAILAGEGAAGVIAVPGDVPLATPAEIERVLAAHLASPSVSPSMTIVPDRKERGSNCIACSPPGALPFRFGEDSFSRHLDAARRRGVFCRVLRLTGLGLDIDRPADLGILLERPGGTRAQVYLKASGIAAGLRGRTDLHTGQSAGRP